MCTWGRARRQRFSAGWLNQGSKPTDQKPVRIGNSPSSSNPLGKFHQPPSTEKMSNNFEKKWRNTSNLLTSEYYQAWLKIMIGNNQITRFVQDTELSWQIEFAMPQITNLQRGLGKEKYIKRALVGFTTWYLLLIPFIKSWYLLFCLLLFLIGFRLFYQLPLLARGQSDSLSSVFLWQSLQ